MYDDGSQTSTDYIFKKHVFFDNILMKAISERLRSGRDHQICKLWINEEHNLTFQPFFVKNPHRNTEKVVS